MTLIALRHLNTQKRTSYKKVNKELKTTHRTDYTMNKVVVFNCVELQKG